MLFLLIAPLLTLLYFFATALPAPVLAAAAFGFLFTSLLFSCCQQPPRTKRVLSVCLASMALAALLLWNGWTTLGWLEPGLGRSFLSIGFLAALPAAAFLGALRRGVLYPKPAIPLATWSIGICILLSTLALGAELGDVLRVPMTIEEAGVEIRGLLGERQRLPLFGGLIAGGVWSATAFTLALFSLRLAKSIKLQIALAVVAAAGAAGAIITDTRSAILSVVLMLVLFSARVCLVSLAARRLTFVVVAISIVLPLSYPALVQPLEDASAGGGGLLDRGYGRVTDLSGRLDIWRSVLSSDVSLQSLLFGSGPFAEYTTGLYKEIQYTPYFSGRLFGEYGQYMHAHSLFLNIYASNGLVGCGLVLWFLMTVANLLASSSHPASIPLLMAWNGLILMGTTESLLSGLYINMPIVFFVVALEAVALAPQNDKLSLHA
jgi:O-antigen ligase